MSDILLGFEVGTVDVDTQYMVDFAYWAGLFDGEGSIGIYKYQNKDHYHKSPTYSVQLGLTMTDKNCIDEFSSLFKGSRAVRDEHKRSPNARTQYYWQSRGNIAIANLKALLPFLRLKKRHAGFAIEFHERKGANPSRPLTTSEIQLREDYYQKMRLLNLRGRKHE